MFSIMGGRFIAPGQADYAKRIPGYDQMTAAQQQASEKSLQQEDRSAMRQEIHRRNPALIYELSLKSHDGFHLEEAYARLTGSTPTGWTRRLEESPPSDVDIDTSNLNLRLSELPGRLVRGSMGFMAHPVAGLTEYSRNLAPTGEPHRFSLPDDLGKNREGLITPAELDKIKTLARADIPDATPEQVSAYNRAANAEHDRVTTAFRSMTDRATLERTFESLGFKSESVTDLRTGGTYKLFRRKDVSFSIPPFGIEQTKLLDACKSAAWAVGSQAIIDRYAQLLRGNDS